MVRRFLKRMLLYFSILKIGGCAVRFLPGRTLFLSDWLPAHGAVLSCSWRGASGMWRGAL